MIAKRLTFCVDVKVINFKIYEFFFAILFKYQDNFKNLVEIGSGQHQNFQGKYSLCLIG